MHRKYIYIATAILLTILVGCEKYDDHPELPASDFIAEGKYQGDYWPTEAWRECDPGEVGMDPKKLKELNEEVRLLLDLHYAIHNILIIKDGYIVAEQYYSDDYGPDDLHRVYSCTKSVTSSLLGIAVEQGLLDGVDGKMVDFFPEYEIQNMSADKQNITLEHLLTMSSGLEWYEMDYFYSDERNSLNQWFDNGGTVKWVLDRPAVAPPGTEFSYSTGTSHILSAIVQRITGMRADSFALKQLFDPIGIDDFYWPLDDDGVAYGGSGMRLTPRDMARFGYLYLMDGMWDGEQIVPEAWVEASQEKHIIRKYIPDSYYGYQFWVSDYGTYSAVGFRGQWIMVVPEHGLVVVFNNWLEEGDSNQWNTPERLLNTYIIPAVD